MPASPAIVAPAAGPEFSPPSPTNQHQTTACRPPADEKHNFERLQRTTVLNKQPLLVPQPLELSPTEELTVRCVRVGTPCLQVLPLCLPASQTVAAYVLYRGGCSPCATCHAIPHPACPACRDNLEVFRQNGFHFTDDPASGRLLLAAVPFRCSCLLPACEEASAVPHAQVPAQLCASCQCSSPLLLLLVPAARTSPLV